MQAAVREVLDPGQREVVDVDEVVVARDAGADQVDLGRAAGEEGAAGSAATSASASSTVAARL